MTFTINDEKYRVAFRLAVVAEIVRENSPQTVAAEIAVMNPADTWSTEKGAKLALSRALKRVFKKCDRTNIWPQLMAKGRFGRAISKLPPVLVLEDIGF